MLRESKPIARKTYTCNASEWLYNGGLDDFVFHYEPTCAELRAIVKARRNGWCIVPGQQYIKQVGKYEGDFYVWRAIPAIHAICLKYDLYEYV